METLLVILLVGLGSLIHHTDGHGYLVNPPARNSMWRYGFKNPVNYNDNELFCGGAFKMKGLGGRCGVCGDQVNLANQPHADGGKYANNIIVRNYRQGQVIDIDIKLTTAHWGYFEFRIGAFDNRKTVGDGIGKLQGHLLKLDNGSTRFAVPDSNKSGRYNLRLKLPRGLSCRRCVLQWWYKGGNNWGCDSKGCGMGHGTQEHFVNCADVRIQ